MAGKNKKLQLTALTAISPLDGRYHTRTNSLSSFVSEFALIKTRFEIEIKYIIALSKIKIIRRLTKNEEKKLLSIIDNFSLENAEEVKKIEQEVRHDVKSIEKFFRNILKNSSLNDLIEIIHFGLTSEDINNLSYRLMLKRATNSICVPELDSIIATLVDQSKKYKKTPMLARTHGQAAIPTTLGKELIVFALRLQKDTTKLKSLSLSGKLNGAVGNFNALHSVYPHISWISFSQKFTRSLGLTPNIATTQINTYEDITEYLQTLHRINCILIDFNQDMWRYISDNWYVQQQKSSEVGSSTMPQKVNPIDFENSEGNLQIANSLIEGLCRKLPISRLQRDLSDSTSIRNIGTILGYSLLGYTSISTGLSRVSPNISYMEEVLLKDWSILTEGVQTILRVNNVSDPYTLIKNVSRGKQITEQEWKKWISELPIQDSNKKLLYTLTPKSYIGLASEIVDATLKELKTIKK